MFPMRSRDYFHLPLRNWAQNAIGKAYVHLHPKSELWYYWQHTPACTHSGPTIETPLQMVNGVFTKGIGFYNGYHLDPNDRNDLTHCTVTTPNPYLPEEEQVGGMFAIGSNVFDYSCANFYFIFSWPRVSHYTGVSYNVPNMPESLKGNKCFNHVVENKEFFKEYLKKKCCCLDRIWCHKCRLIKKEAECY